MNGALDWIGQFFESVALFVPRRVIVRATHRGIKWKRGKHVCELVPGVHWYWPFLSEVENHPVARQTVSLPTQTLLTKDDKQVVVGAIVVYRINDVVLAIGERNYDFYETMRDISQSAIVEVITHLTIDELRQGIDSTVIRRLTRKVRSHLRKYGISVLKCSLTDFATCRVYKLLGDHQRSHDGLGLVQ
jgi:regulator of protease activity HflC (stomatin/prohibitin superfamily)